MPPLETDDSEKKSDHRIAYVQTELKRARAFEWIKYSYCYYSQEGEKEFGDWLVNHRWQGALDAESSNYKTNLYQSQLQEAIDRCFPIKTTRCKSTDLPWINGLVRHKIMKRKRLYMIEGRSDRWKAMKKAIEELIKKRRDTYRTVQLENFTELMHRDHSSKI